MKIKTISTGGIIKEVNAKYKMTIKIGDEDHTFALNNIRENRFKQITHLESGRVATYVGVVEDLPAKEMRLEMVKAIDLLISRFGDKRVLEVLNKNIVKP